MYMIADAASRMQSDLGKKTAFVVKLLRCGQVKNFYSTFTVTHMLTQLFYAFSGSSDHNFFLLYQM